MVQQDTLSSVLREFARTLTTDFPIQGILDHLVGRIVEVLPVSAAGVTLISDGGAPRYVAASDASALTYERLQTEVGEGPCLLAYGTGASVSVPDLAADDRFPRYGPLAVAAGLVAVWTFPLRHGEQSLGALDLYHDHVGDLAEDDMDAAQTLADVAAAYLLNAEAREEAATASEGYQHRSLHDPLTGLPNRALLDQRMEHAARRSARSRTRAAVLFVDLDRFKQVNDTFGHAAGDQLLLAVARRLSHLVRPGDTLARVSGDEFVFLCEDLHDVGDAEALTRRIAAAFAEPFSLDEREVEMSASVGMAFAEDSDAITPQLLADADRAMYRVKRAGRSVDGLLPMSSVSSVDRTELAYDLRQALSRGRLSVRYQPVVDLHDGHVGGVEALLRWDDPGRGWVPAPDMIAAADASGLVHELGVWVLERACRDRARWLRFYPSSPLDIAVNVSVVQLQRPEFLQTVSSVLARTRTDPAALVLEITEDVLVEDGPRVVELFSRLRGLGVRLALDDFGTGYSSLSYLRRLPVDVLKIDRTFVADIDHDEACAAVVSAVVQLAHVLALSVVAEGVESSGQRDRLLALGCEAGQGFVFSPPLTSEGVCRLLARGVVRRPEWSGVWPEAGSNLRPSGLHPLSTSLT